MSDQRKSNVNNLLNTAAAASVPANIPADSQIASVEVYSKKPDLSALPGVAGITRNGKKELQVYSRLSELPTGRADTSVLQPGCLVLEGGAWRGMYTQGVLDALMQAGIAFQTVIGVSAGAMGAAGYICGQIGWTARINLTYRQDPNYCGTGALRRDHGITGFSYLYGDITRHLPMDRKALYDKRRRLVVVATDVETGEAVYFDRDHVQNILRCIQASATVPYVSRPVTICGRKYLDGGCSNDYIPYHWAEEQGFDKIMVVRTRNRAYRDTPEESAMLRGLNRALYRRHPALLDKLQNSHTAYNALCDGLDEREKDGRVFVLAPHERITISRFESDMEKLGDLYWMGYHDCREQVPALREYLQK